MAGLDPKGAARPWVRGLGGCRLFPPRGASRALAAPSSDQWAALSSPLPEAATQGLRLSQEHCGRRLSLCRVRLGPGRGGAGWGVRLALTWLLCPSPHPHRHIFLGFSKCGRYVLSYTSSSGDDDFSFYIYHLYWWEFNVHSKLRLVGPGLTLGVPSNSMAPTGHGTPLRLGFHVRK